MKRIEAVLLLSEKLQKNIHRMRHVDDNPKIHCDNLALIALKCMEDAGMAPPELEGKYVDGRVQKRGWETEE